MDLGVKDGTVRLCEYDPEWAAEAARMISRLEKLLAGQDIYEYQHVGSTAVPGMPAKPIIDIAAAIMDESVVERCRPLLEADGFGYYGKIKDDDWMYYTGHPGMKDHTHHIHFVTAGSEVWTNYLAFRDYLTAFPEAAGKYEEVKRMAARKMPGQREEYQMEKESVIREILDSAIRWWNEKNETSH